MEERMGEGKQLGDFSLMKYNVLSVLKTRFRCIGASGNVRLLAWAHTTPHVSGVVTSCRPLCDQMVHESANMLILSQLYDSQRQSSFWISRL